MSKVCQVTGKKPQAEITYPMPKTGIKEPSSQTYISTNFGLSLKKDTSP